MKLLFLALALSLGNSVARADSDQMLDYREPIEDRVGSAKIEYEHLAIDSKPNVDRILVDLEFYGIQQEGLPNRTHRWMWLETKIGGKSLMSMREGQAADYVEVNLVPYTYSRNWLPDTNGDARTEGDESHHQIMALQYVQDAVLGVNQGVRIRPYSYKRTFSDPQDVRGYVGLTLLGYALDQRTLDNGETTLQHLIHVASLDGGMRMRVRNTPRTRVFFEVLRGGVEGNVPLNSDRRQPTPSFAGHIETALSLDIFKKDMRSLLGQVRVHAGLKGWYNGEPTRNWEGQPFADQAEQDTGPADGGGYGYVGASMLFYLD